MRVPRSIIGSLPVAAVLLLAASSSLAAQRRSRELFSWSGSVDREIRIAMRDNDVWTRALGNESSRDRSRVSSRLPHDDGRVSVQVLDGRGNVDVMQQPSASNDYTTIIRVRDLAGGADQYRINAYWEPTYGGWDGNSRPRVEGRDDRGGRARDEDRYGNNGRGNDNGRGYGNGRGRDDDRYSGAGSLHWSGAVDGDMEIRVRQRGIDYRTLSGNSPRDVQAQVTGAALGRRDATVWLRDTRGRGQVTLVQQPSASNDYTAVIRVRDPLGGYGRYDFDVVWK